MSRRLSAAPLAAAVAFAFTAPTALAASGPTLTIYSADNDALFSGASQGNLDAGHAVVHEERNLSLQSGSHEVRIGGLPATIDPEAVAVGFGNGSGITVLGRRVVLANGSANGALDGAIGQHVVVATGGRMIDGTLVGGSDGDLLVRSADGIWLIHDYSTVSLPENAISGGSTLLLNVDAGSGGTRNALLTYGTSGLGWRAAYSATLSGGSRCSMHFDPQASIANRSGRDYEDATIKLVAGQPNLGDHRMRMYAMANRVATEATAAPVPVQATLGDYRTFTLPGTVTLPNGTVTLTPLYPAQDLSCTREYVVESGNGGYFPPKPNINDYGSGDYTDRAIASTLSFTAPDALPAGTLRAYTVDRDGAPELLGEGAVADTPKDQKVSVQLGESFDLRASRERTAFHVDIKAHTMSEAYRITLSNGGSVARTVTVREHPSRWREWTLTSSSVKPNKQTPQLLEFKVDVPANGKATLDYAVRYTWTAKEM